ncbi:TPA: hypothetical protein ACUT5H_000248 [Pseudomonas aeruginosa]|uniref:hypothetical protein n=1 Tax=Pseudomonas aeruginosa TaxID=287 RepID=UPI001F1C2163|nr:hypothetical protein [Pseudomonas aeruginosa]
MSQKTQQDSMPIAEAVDLPEISVEHSTEFLTGSAPCAGVSRPLPAAWLGQRGIYRSRLEAVCNGEQLVDPLTLRELIQHAWRYLYLTRRAGLGLKPARQPLTSTTKTPEATDAAVDQMIAEEDADIRQDLTQQAEAERPEVVAWQYRVTAGPQTGWSLWHPGKGEALERSYTVERRPLMTVAQHDRIVGSLRAKADQLREALEWRKENQAGQRELLRSMTAERDAALAEVERLRQFERICEGLPQDAIDGGWTVHGIRAHSKQLEEQLKVAQAEVEALRAENLKLSEALERWPLIRDRLNLRLDYALAKISKLESRWPGKEVPQAWHDVQAERRRQNNAEGWTPEHDDLYCAAELPRAAAAYILSGANDEAPAIWPFVAKWWKPRDARANYVRAGALILAEIERLDRAAASQGGPSDA